VFVYEISEDGKYIYFVQYPQTLMSADMDPETDLEQISDHYYRGTDGEIYYEYTINLDIHFESLASIMGVGIDETAWAYLDQLDASTGEEMKNHKTYYFKMEKIKWRILDNADGLLTIVADTNLQALAYQSNYTENGDNWYTTANGAPEGTYASNYKYSELRRFLNDDFMDMAFSETQAALIQKIEVDNSVESTGETENKYVCENTNDQVWALSVEEVETLIGEDGSSALNSWTADLETSDYARATGIMTYTKQALIVMGESEESVMTYSNYFNTGGAPLRSPYTSKSTHGVALGGIAVLDDMNSPAWGILPALQLKIN